MEAQDFQRWLELTGARFGVDVAAKLGINRETAHEWINLAEAGKPIQVKRTVALAMSAVAQGLRPWDEYER